LNHVIGFRPLVEVGGDTGSAYISSIHDVKAVFRESVEASDVIGVDDFVAA
jgi:hypothetical protein